MLTTWENDIHHLCAQCAAPLSLSCPAALCGWNWWLAWPSLRLLRLCVQLFQVSVMLLCVCLQKWVSLDEGWCWNHSSSYNTMPRLTRFGGPRFWGSLPGNKSVEIPRLWDTGAFRAGPGCRKNYGSYSIALLEISFTSSRFHICVPTWLQILLQIIHAVADLTPLNYRMYPLLPQWRREKSVARIFRILEFRDLCGN